MVADSVVQPSCRDAALDYAASGVAVFPLAPRRKNPLIAGGQGYKDATTDTTQIRTWWDATPRANIGRPTGQQYGALVIEDDPHHSGPDSLAKLEERYGPLPKHTYTVRSGGGGHHRYFRHPGGFIKSADKRFGDEYPSVDVKADGGYVVAPPSIHPNGKGYVVTVDAPLATLPESWLDALMSTQPPPPKLPPDALRGTEVFGGDGKRLLDSALDKKRDGTSDFYGQQLAVQLLVNEVCDPDHWLREYSEAATYDVNSPFTDRDIARWLRSAEQTRIVQGGQPAHNPNGQSSGGPEKQSAGQPKMPTSDEDAHANTMGTLGIFDENGHLRKGIVLLSDIKPEPIVWLWQGRMALGKLTMVDGDPGLGKTTIVAADLAARVATGRDMPDGSPGLGQPRGVIILTAEDGIADTILPRFVAAGGDCRKVMVMKSAVLKALRDGKITEYEAQVQLDRDLPDIRQAIKYMDAALVVIDPLMAYMGDKNSYKDQEVRALLAPVAAMAEETMAAIVPIRHLTKGDKVNAIYRGGGSIAIAGAARSVLLVAKDPDDESGQRCIIAQVKNNLARMAPALAYHVEQVVVEGCEVSRVVWEGATEHTAEQLLSVAVADTESHTMTSEATDWLRTELESMAGKAPVAQIKEWAKAADITDKALRSARQKLCYKPIKGGFEEGWIWMLDPEKVAGLDAKKKAKEEKKTGTKVPNSGEDAQGAHYKTDGTFDENGHLRDDALPSVGPCSVTGGDHVYALMRTADGRRVCIECDEPEGAKEAS